MARRVFFSFHYQRDVWRACQVRNSWVTKTGAEEAGFIDAAAFEAIERRGEDAIKAWIRDQLNGTSVTAVLIGQETWTRPYVQYEIRQSFERGNGLLGIHVCGLADQEKRTHGPGVNPLELACTIWGGQLSYHSEKFATYDWVRDRGYTNLGSWIEDAARRARPAKGLLGF